MLKITSHKIVTSEAPLHNLMGEMGNMTSPLRDMKNTLNRNFSAPGTTPQKTGPGQKNCSICGKYLPNGGIQDTHGVSGKPNALLCVQDAQRLGINPQLGVNPQKPTAR